MRLEKFLDEASDNIFKKETKNITFLLNDFNHAMDISNIKLANDTLMKAQKAIQGLMKKIK